jgi:hypothetical protein
LVKKTRVPGESHRPVTSHCQTLSHNVVSSTPCLNRILTHNVSGTNRLVNLSLLTCTNLNKMKSSLLKITTLEVYKKLYSAYFFHCCMSVVFSSNGSDEISNLYRGPAIDASYQVSVHLAKRFQRR